MKIIKRGKSPEEKTKKETCYNCKSELEYSNKDIKHDRDGSHITCPVCGKFISVNDILPRF